MRAKFRTAIIVLLVALATSTAPASAANPSCTVASIAALRVPRMTVTAATPVPASGADPEYCDVRGIVDTGGNSAGFRFQLPVHWNRKLLFYGVGGTGGSVLSPSANAVDRASALAKGYATAVTDTGHQNPSNADASFALSGPGVANTAALTDYYHRAAHEVTVALKTLLPAFYDGVSIERSYFDGCSNGGRMALEAAKRYPADYDGIIAGAPALSQRYNLLMLKGARSALAAGARIPAELLPVIDAAVYDKCDGADGVRDHLIQDPARCSFDPHTLVCPGGNAARCLTEAQAEGLANYLRPLTNQEGHVVAPAYSVTDLAGEPSNYTGYALGAGAPVDPSGSRPWAAEPPARGWALGDMTLKNIVYRDPNFDSRLFPMTADGRIDDAALARFDAATAGGNVEPADLSAFIARNGKLILYHGFADHGLSPFMSIRFYEQLAEQNAWHYEALQKQVRLFMVPGMFHCGNGPGPNTFDTLTALEGWVEQSVAPDTLLATHTTAGVVDRTMPLCKFPEMASYRGSGDMNDAANWSCAPGAPLLGGAAAK